MADADAPYVAGKLSQGGIMVLTGAGISVDSGIPDFRSMGGLWQKFDPAEYATIEAFQENPRKVWRMFAELEGTLRATRPNAGHLALARLGDLVSGVVTQNIDGLHQAAGSKNVIEYHGSGRRLVCLSCREGYEPDAPASWEDGQPRIPLCACGTVLKPDVVLFGEMIPYPAVRASRELASRAKTCLVCGTSALVHPASALPALAKEAGAIVIEVNLERTPLTDRVTDVFLQGSTTTVLPALADLVLRER